MIDVFISLVSLLLGIRWTELIKLVALIGSIIVTKTCYQCLAKSVSAAVITHADCNLEDASS